MHEKHSTNEWEEIMEQARVWKARTYRTLHDPVSLRVILYFLQNPQSKKDSLQRGLEGVYVDEEIIATYKALTTSSPSTIPVKLLRELPDGTIYVPPYTSKILRSFVTFYREFGDRIEGEKLDKAVSDSSIEVLPSDPNSKLYFEEMSEEERKAMNCEAAVDLFELARENILEDRMEIKTSLLEIGKHLKWD